MIEGAVAVMGKVHADLEMTVVKDDLKSSPDQQMRQGSVDGFIIYSFHLGNGYARYGIKSVEFTRQIDADRTFRLSGDIEADARIAVKGFGDVADTVVNVFAFSIIIQSLAFIQISFKAMQAAVISVKEADATLIYHVSLAADQVILILMFYQILDVI